MPTSEFDAVVAYYAGPFCGIPPEVSVEGNLHAITIAVELITRGSCEAMQYVELFGLRFATQPEIIDVQLKRRRTSTERQGA